MKKMICYLCVLSVLFFSGCGQAQEGVRGDKKDILKNAELTENVEESTQESKDGPEKEEESGITLSVQGWEIINRVDKDLPKGYEEVQLSYMNASDFGVDCYEEVWSSKEEREALAQTALKELYTFTGENIEGCIYYYTDGRSLFVFSDSPGNMKMHKNIYYRDYGFELSGEDVPKMAWAEGTPILLDILSEEKSADGEPQSHLERVLLQVLGNSGLYGGQKIEACKVIYPDLERESYFHLEFAGGYYEVVTDKTAQMLMRISGPHFYEEEEEKQLPIPAYMTDISDEVYQGLITQLIETGCFPVCNYGADGLIYNQTYAILDIDEDGREELIINFSNASAMAGMVYYIYDYDRTTGEVYIESAGWPDVDFLDNGYVKEDASHNHGRSNLDDFWPYHLLVYNEETDQYDTVAQIDAWQKELHPEGFPEEADKDGDGIVYYTADVQFWTPTAFMDKAEYDTWCEQYNKGTAKIIQWKTIMTPEDYVAIYMQDAVG